MNARTLRSNGVTHTVYHGSNVLFDDIDFERSRDRRDFGRGFHTTTIREQAEGWARSLNRRYGQGLYVDEYEFTPSPEVRIKQFDGLTLEWLEMVKENRTGGGVQHGFDIVIGPVADDDTMPTIALYVDGTLSAEAALVQLAYSKANDQVSFHTPRSLTGLRFAGRSEL